MEIDDATERALGQRAKGPFPSAARPDCRYGASARQLAATIDWGFLEQRLGSVYSDAPGHPPLPTRLMAGLAILKHMHDLSDEALCARWLENPYFQLFCGEEFFQHRLVFDRSSMTRWRQRWATAGRPDPGKPDGGDENRRGQAGGLFQSDRRHHRAAKGGRPSTDAKLMHRAREKLVELAKKHGVVPRQSYRAGRQICADRLSALRPRQAVQARQARAAAELRTYLGRVIRDIARKIKATRR